MRPNFIKFPLSQGVSSPAVFAQFPHHEVVALRVYHPSMGAAPWHPVRRPCRARNDARLRGRASMRSHESGPRGEQARRAEGGVCSLLRKRDVQRTGERSLLLIGRARLTRRDRRRDRNGAWNAAWYQAPHEQQRNARHSHRLFLAASLLQAPLLRFERRASRKPAPTIVTAPIRLQTRPTDLSCGRRRWQHQAVRTCVSDSATARRKMFPLRVCGL